MNVMKLRMMRNEKKHTNYRKTLKSVNLRRFPEGREGGGEGQCQHSGYFQLLCNFLWEGKAEGWWGRRGMEVGVVAEAVMQDL